MKMNRIKIYFDWLWKDSAKQLAKVSKRTIPNYDLIKLGFQTLFYNVHSSRSLTYRIDTLLEPCYWFVDNHTKTFGPIFVFLIVLLLGLYILIAYIVGLPFWIAKSLPITILALVLGNYLMINALFHYFMAYKTDPGSLPPNVFVKNSVSICKKCIAPKPPRLHHCGVCDRCILSFDHHCPWLNNCVGHYNVRYFFMFCLFAWLGTIFVIIFGIPVALNYYFNIDIFDEQFELINLFKLDNYLNATTTLDPAIVKMDEYMQIKYFNPIKMNYENVKNNCIIFEIILTGSAFVAIGFLMSWHARHITNGETCVDALRNRKERLRLKRTGEKFVNPFDKGPINNWKRFLGLDQKDVGLRCLFFPSCHKPTTNGIDFDIYS